MSVISSVAVNETNSMMNHALEYISNGYKVFPLKPRGKIPLTQHGLNDATETEEGVRQYWSRWPEANIGLVTHNLIVLDFDVKNGGLESKAQLIAKYGEFPQTRVHRTGGGGEHWLYDQPKGINIRNTTNWAGYKGVDIRANGGYIVVPPSIHETGNRYEVIDDSPIAPAPAWLLELVTTKPSASVPSNTTSNGHSESITEGQRNDTLTSLAGSMQYRGITGATILAALKSENQLRCSPPLSDSEVEGIAKSISRYQPTAIVASQISYNLTDTGNAELLVNLFGDRLKYDHRRTRWLIWNGNIWQPDTDGEITRLATESARERYRRATTIQDLKERDRTASWAISSENRGRLEAAVTLVQNILPVADSGENWDTDPWLLGCKNGILDLKTGQLRPGHQTDRITMMIATNYDRDADCPTWKRHINLIMGGNQENITYLQRIFGYALTGDTSEDCLFFFYGQTRTGKSVTLGTIQDLLGDYAKETASETFFIKKYAGSNDDIARLAGSRLVAAIEDEHQEKLAAGLVKHLTGRDKVIGRFLYKERFEFKPTFKIFLAANDKPLIRGEDSGIWERLKCVPFEQFIAREQRVKNLREQLQKEWAGILNWCIQGCLDWQREHDLNEPKAVTEATDLYRREMDKLADFIDAHCNIGKGESVTIAAMYEAYIEWARDQETEPLSKATFGDKVKNRNFTKKRTGHKGEWRWVGIGLRSNADNADNTDNVSIHSPRENITRGVYGKADSNDSMSANEAKMADLFGNNADNADKQNSHSDKEVTRYP